MSSSPPPAKKLKTSASTKGLPTSFKIVAGSYEKLLYGLHGSVRPDGTFVLHPIFIFPAHVSCIKAVAISPHGGKWLATGSADEIVKIWDLRRRKEIGGLMHHQGSITHLVFPSRSHLLSASDDGTLCLFHTRDWEVLRSLKGHKGRVNSVAVHPSGKVALSVGADRTLRMWDFMRGKGVASTKLGKEGELVRWSSDGAQLVVQSGSTLDVYNTEMEMVRSIKHTARVHDVLFIRQGERELMLVAAEDKRVAVYDQDKIIGALVGHGNRVKAVQTLAIALPSGETTEVAATVSSDGKIRVFDLGGVEGDIECVAEYDTKGTRLTCVSIGDDGEPVTVAEEEEEDWGGINTTSNDDVI